MARFFSTVEDPELLTAIQLLERRGLNDALCSLILETCSDRQDEAAVMQKLILRGQWRDALELVQSLAAIPSLEPNVRRLEFKAMKQQLLVILITPFLLI